LRVDGEILVLIGRAGAGVIFGGGIEELIFFFARLVVRGALGDWVFVGHDERLNAGSKI
jgi:hypothetical protein